MYGRVTGKSKAIRDKLNKFNEDFLLIIFSIKCQSLRFSEAIGTVIATSWPERRYIKKQKNIPPLSFISYLLKV